MSNEKINLQNDKIKDIIALSIKQINKKKVFGYTKAQVITNIVNEIEKVVKNAN